MRESSIDELLRELPSPPPHGFTGRTGELRQAEQLLERQRQVILLGEHGEGKTTLATELARRLFSAGRVERVAYVSMEIHHDARGARYAVGQQLVPGYRLAVSQDPRLGLQLLERVLRERPTLVVVDDLDVVLPRSAVAAPERGAPDPSVFEPTVFEQFLVLGSEMAKVGETHLILVTRERLPEPFHRHEIFLEGMARDDAFELVRRVCSVDGLDAARIEPLVDGVGAHAGSLVCLAREIAASGLGGAAGSLAESAAMLAGLELGERRRALALGAEIALRSVPEGPRRKLPQLGVFHGGGHLTAIAAVLGLDFESDEEVNLAEQLIHLGLAAMLPDNYVRFHPALGAALRAELGGEELTSARAAWAEATAQLVGFLHQQQIKNPQLAASLALSDLRNLLACLKYLHETADADDVVEMASALEALVGPLGRPESLALVERIRDEATGKLSDWSHVRCMAELETVELLMDAGRPEETINAAEKLLHRAETVGEEAYDGADHDLATIHLTLGLARLVAGDAEHAMTSLEEARRRFHDLAKAGNETAARMEGQALARTGDALRSLSMPVAAGELYERAIEVAERIGDHHQAAEVKTQLGALYLTLQRTQEALGAYHDARRIFAQLDEPQTVAGLWLQIGAVHESTRRFDEAEAAYREALELEQELDDRTAAGCALGELGGLYAGMGRLAEAVDVFERAAAIFAEVDDLAKEGIARSLSADALIRLERYDEARRELERTAECDAPFGHEVKPWRTFSMLMRLEAAVGREEAQLAARQKAIRAYYEFRRDGGECQVGHGEIFAEVSEAITGGETAEVASKLAAVAERDDLPNRLKALIPALQEVLAGSRDRALAANPGLYYRDAAELLLKIEELEEARLPTDVVF